MAQGKPAQLGAPLFVRSATGLLREVPVADQWLFNAFMVNLGLGGVYLFEFGPWARPNANLFLITIIGGIGFIAVAATYGLLSSAFPRTGGDYVFNSRILGGGIGFWCSWVNCVTFATIGGASVAWFFAHSGIPFALSLIARVVHNTAIESWASASASTTWTTVTATALIVLSALALIRGLGFLIRVQRWLFLFGLVGLLVVIVLLALTRSSQYAAMYDSIAGPGAYADVMRVALQHGFGGGWSWGDTLSLFPVMAVPALFAVSTNWFAGELQEVRSPQKSIVSMASVVAVYVVLSLLLTVLIYRSVGANFLQAIDYMYFSGITKGYGFASDPNYFALASVTTGSVVVLALLALGWLAWSIMWTPGNMLWPIRIMFAWSFDRVVPERLSEVNPLTNTPVLATVIITLLVEASLLAAQYSATMQSIFVATSFVLNVAMTVTCIAGALFPFRKKDLFERSPANIRWGGIPLITITGVIASITMIVTDIEFLTVKELFVWAPSTFWYAGVIAVLGVVIYVLARWIRQRQGIDLSLVFSEIPPE